MALRYLVHLQRQVGTKTKSVGTTASVYTFAKKGKREVVGHGLNGTYCYHDSLSMPMPGVRFKEPSNESVCLQAKEQLSWSKLSLDEKKALYRYSFCQTFSEMKAPTGEWKMHVASGIFAVVIGLWVLILNHSFLYGEIPESFDEEHQKAQLKRMLDLEVNPITGLSSKWDYENKRWK